MKPIKIRNATRKWKMTILAATLLMISLALNPFSPIKTVKGLLVDTGIPVNNQSISIDAGRVVMMNLTSRFDTGVQIYDLNSGNSVVFGGPNGAGSSMFPVIYGNKIVAFGNITSSLSTFTTLSYCILPNTSPLQSCGQWHLLASGLLSQNTIFAYGPAAIHGDLIAWWTPNGLAYFHFSSNVTERIPFTPPYQPISVSTNGEIIAFTLVNNPGPNECGYLEYIDTTSGSDTPINTGVFNCAKGIAPGSSMSQSTIALMDNSTGQNRIRYFDYLRNQASPAGQGPLGNLTSTEVPAIFGDRIVFTASEKSLNFDCDADGVISQNQDCLEYWNIRAPSYVATTLAAKAAPGILGLGVAIYGNTIAFTGKNGNLQYVTVPMQGDVDQDGVVDNTDKTDVTNCLNQVLKGSIC